jgi:BlaI family transcriptional regulator, penicillinase repressor
MPRPPSQHPTELELLLLKTLWKTGPATVRHVQTALAEHRELAYTSVITMLNIMWRKGYLRRKRVNGSFVYQPKVSERATAGGMLRDLVDRVFKGSAVNVVIQLLDDQLLDPTELEELRDLVDRAESSSGKEQEP